MSDLLPAPIRQPGPDASLGPRLHANARQLVRDHRPEEALPMLDRLDGEVESVLYRYGLIILKKNPSAA